MKNTPPSEPEQLRALWVKVQMALGDWLRLYHERYYRQMEIRLLQKKLHEREISIHTWLMKHAVWRLRGSLGLKFVKQMRVGLATPSTIFSEPCKEPTETGSSPPPPSA